MELDLSRGFVAFPRGLTSWEWYTSPNTARLYFHLLLCANWTCKEWQGITIQPGQLVTSVSRLAMELALTVPQVRTALEHLQSTKYIAIETTSKYSVITLLSYDVITDIRKQDSKPERRQITIRPQTVRKQIATTIPSIPLQPEKPREPSSSPRTPSAHALLFEQYEKGICPLNARARTELAEYADKLGEEVAAAVVAKCADLGARSWAYVRKALNDAGNLGCRSAAEYRQLSPIGGSRAKGTRVDRAAPSDNRWMETLADPALRRARMRHHTSDADSSQSYKTTKAFTALFPDL